MITKHRYDTCHFYFMEEKKMKKRIYVTGVALCTLMLCVSLFQIVSHYVDGKKHTDDFAQLAEFVEQAEEPKGEGAVSQEGENTQLLHYRELAEQNGDLAGWISIEGTSINYPVMYTPDSPDFYLKHNFEKESSDYGVPYLAENCDSNGNGDNLIIYGHHIKGGRMFGALMDYTRKEFYESHRIIRFDTLEELAEYEVVAVFKTTVYDDTGFKYYLFTNADKEADFNAYVKECKALALYDTGVKAVYGDKLISLSTCEYSSPNGRLVVVAKKVTE